jgi:dethiobiotin synthetase
LAAEVVIVEGVGGWCLPINPEQMQADLVRRLRLPVVMVAAIRLGGLNHSLLTARTIEADGCDLIGWVANIVDPSYVYAQQTIDSLLPKIHAPLLGQVIWGSEEENQNTHQALLDATAMLSRARHD